MKKSIFGVNRRLDRSYKAVTYRRASHLPAWCSGKDAWPGVRWSCVRNPEPSNYFLVWAAIWAGPKVFILELHKYFLNYILCEAVAAVAAEVASMAVVAVVAAVAAVEEVMVVARH